MDSEPTKGILGDDKLWQFFFSVMVIVDLWKAYLTLRNILSLRKISAAPPVLRMSPAEFSQLRDSTMSESTYILFIAMVNLGCKCAKLMTNYYPYVWELSGRYAETLMGRAVCFSVLDAVFDHCKFIPVGILSAAINGRVDPFLVFLTMSIKTAAVGLSQALSSYLAITISDHFGPSGILKLSLITNTLGLLFVAIYISYLVPKIHQPLPDSEMGRSVTELADSVGFPANLIFVDTRESLPNAFYTNALFSKMIIITFPLTLSLNPGQLTSVVAHELGHWYYLHPLITFCQSVIEITSRGAMWIVAYGNPRLSGFFRLDSQVHPVIPVLLTNRFIRPPFFDVLQGIFKLYSTHCEYVADDFAGEVSSLSNLREALVIMGTRSKFYPLFDDWFSAWFFGHPTLVARIERINSHQ